MARLCQLSLYNNVTFIYLCFESECLLINRKYLRQNTHLLFSMFAYIKQFRLIIYFALKCFIFQSPQIESFAFYNDQIVPTQPVINNGNAHSKGIYSYSIILENRLFSPFTKVYCVIKHVYLVYIVQVQQLLIIVLDSGWFRVYRIFQRPCRINIGTKYGQTVMCVTIDRSIKTTIRTFVTVESFEFVVVHFLCYINQPNPTTLDKKK